MAGTLALALEFLMADGPAAVTAESLPEPPCPAPRAIGAAAYM